MGRRPRPDEGSARVSAGLAAAVALHAMLIGGGFLWGYFQRAPDPQAEPIAVELVEEPPPEEIKQPDPVAENQPEAQPEAAQEAAQEPPPPEEQKAELPPAVPLDLAPATDAPKSSQNDQELTIGDNASGPPVIAAVDEPKPKPEEPPIEPPKPLPEPDPPKEPVKAEAPPAQPEAAQDAPPTDPIPPDAEGLPALAQPKPVEKPETDEANADKPETLDPKRFAFFAPVPKMEFESGSKQSRTPPGNANDTYTSRLYGMIVPNVRLPGGLPSASRRRPLKVEFVVDGQGRLAGAAVVRSSGIPALDIAVLYAIRQASPFPPTPHGKPLPLVLDYEPP